MPPISFLTILVAACAVVAWLLILRRGTTSYAPVALLLTWGAAFTIARAWIQISVLAPARAALPHDAPYVGDTLPWYYAEIALRLTWPFAILAVCVWMYLRRSPWWLALLWSACAAALAGAYPELRRRPQGLVEASIASACWIASAATVWWGHRRRRIDPPGCYVPTAMILGAQLAVILIVQWLGRDDEEWSIARAIQGVVYAVLLGYQATKLLRPSWISQNRQRR